MSNFGKLSVTYKNKVYDYLINTQVLPHVMDKAIEEILKYYPPDAPVDFDENPKITSRNTLQDIINRDNESK